MRIHRFRVTVRAVLDPIRRAYALQNQQNESFRSVPFTLLYVASLSDRPSPVLTSHLIDPTG